MYCPLSAGTFSSGQINVTTSQGNMHKLTCSGNAVSPCVTISRRAIDFGSLPLGTSVSSSLSIFNMSMVHVSFQFKLTGSSIFDLQPEKGVIAPQSTVCVKAYFEPGEAANYYKRVFCIIQDCHPLYCDLVGCCFLDKVNFPTLQLSDLSKHRDVTGSVVKYQIHELDAYAIAEDANTELSICPNPTSLLNNVTIIMNKEETYENLSPNCSLLSWHETSSSGALFGKHPRRLVEQACTTDNIWEEYFFGKTLSSVDVAPKSINFGTILCTQTEKRV